ncbi:hypothetical protein CAPTEDRAFT_182296 [Capitella teleta]|uniref:EIPR1-like beta-propeller domain-containing protein n=1 Tax=Capitella teleta TaxID=283909 RepID=R7TJS8_CAPTE|nr:hypothetical protein CAPTEDRAFT_182296 [Capitella teleta]|eukprot:ELT94083.1 hypothetical protein CAPTEDRAFT_182296 [Capitella teleta]
MDDDAAVIYGLEFQARALTAQTAETDAIRFFVGTQSLRFDNQIHQIDFDDENNVINKNIFLHREGEIWDMKACTYDRNILATIYNTATSAKAEMRGMLWKVPEEFDTSLNDDNATVQSLQPLASLYSADHGDLKALMWHPSGDTQRLITLADNHILSWELDGPDARVSSATPLEGKGQPRFTTGAWNPHHNSSQIATANENAIRGWDLRSMKQTYCIESAHSQLVRGLDFNPNKQYYLASCGDDCKARFWDVRNCNEPVKVLADHSHWVWGVRYNNFHDQLVLTSSSDSRVILTNTSSISSEPFGHYDDEDEEEMCDKKEGLEDGVICTYEEHEDSVYAVEWSTADPWLFASLSYDGRLVINRVPRNIKYNILL